MSELLVGLGWCFPVVVACIAAVRLDENPIRIKGDES